MYLEAIFRRQLERSKTMEPLLALYWQDITQRKEPKDYKKLKFIVKNFLEEQLLKRNQAAMTSKNSLVHPSKGGGKGDEPVIARTGVCRKLKKTGKCAAGSNCPWAASHTQANKPAPRERSPEKDRDRSPGRPRGRSPTNRTGKERDKTKSPPAPRKRGKSPSGEADRPPCFRYLKGQCTDAECKYWHPPACREFKKDGKCSKGKKCDFLHAGPRSAAAKGRANPAVQADKDEDEDKPSGRTARFPGWDQSAVT